MPSSLRPGAVVKELRRLSNSTNRKSYESAIAKVPNAGKVHCLKIDLPQSGVLGFKWDLPREPK